MKSWSLALCCIAQAYNLSATAAPELLPSEATTLMVRAIYHRPTVARTELTGPIIARMRTENLDEVERFLRGEAYFINFEPEAARDAFWEFRDRADDLGRVAWQRLMIIRINAFNMVDQVLDRDIATYRRRFAIRADDRYGISYPIMQAALQLAAKGEQDRALDLIVAEVRLHDAFDAPYFAYRLPDMFMDLAEEQGRGDEFRALRRWVADGVARALKQHLAEKQAPERRAFRLPGSMPGTLYEDERRDHYDWAAELLKLEAQLSRSK